MQQWRESLKCLWRLRNRCANRGVWLEWSGKTGGREGRERGRRGGRREGKEERGGEERGEAVGGKGRGEGRRESRGREGRGKEKEDEEVSVKNVVSTMHYKKSSERFMLHLPTTLQLCAFTVTSYQGVSPLHYAVCSGSMDIVRYSVSHGVDVNQQDHEGW